MNYRPDNWGNPFHKTGDFGHGVEMWNEQPEFSAFEAGADAMLRGLRENNWGNYCKGTASEEFFEFQEDGCVVFIPDEETE